MDSTWTLETLIWLPVAAILAVTLVGVSVWGFRKAVSPETDSWDRGPWRWIVGFGSAVLATLLVTTTALGMYPYKAEYHQWRGHEGTVAKIDHRLIGSGGGMEDKFVVRFDGSSQQFGCDDTRCAGVEVGDVLALSCKRTWQYTGTDGYDCRFVSTEPK